MYAAKNPETPTAASKHKTAIGGETAAAAGATKTRWADAGFTLEELKGHDQKAWRTLVTKLGRIAENCLRESFANPGDLQPLTFSDAEELTAEICETLYVRINEFTTIDHIEASFRKSLNHKAIDRKRTIKAQRRGGGNTISAEDPEVRPGAKVDPIESSLNARIAPFTNDAIKDDGSTIVDGAAIESVGEDVLLRKIIFDCATELNEKDRKFVALLYENRSQDEIAQALGINVKNVTEVQNRIFKKLKPKLQARLGQQGLKDYDIEEN